MKEIQTSLFTSFGDRNPRLVSVYDFVTANIYRDQIERIRDTDDPETIVDLKEALPFITPACICRGGHGKECIISQTGFISIDFDNGHPAKKNLHITNWIQFIDRLRSYNNVFFAGISASGKGGYAIIPLLCPDKFMESFLGIQHAFKKELGVEIESGCHNVNRLRFASFNTPETSFCNPGAKPWRHLIEQTPVNTGAAFQASATPTIALFNALARRIETRSKKPQSFTSGSRHTFTIALAGACAWAGIPMGQTIEWIFEIFWYKEPDYRSCIDEEIKGIKDAYGYAGSIGRARIT